MLIRLALFSLIVPGVLFAQGPNLTAPNPVIRYVAAAPTGLCTTNTPEMLISSTYGVFRCVSGLWTEIYPDIVGQTNYVLTSGSYTNPLWLVGISASIIGSKNVDDTEFGFLNGLTGNVQSQLNDIYAQIAVLQAGGGGGGGGGTGANLSLNAGAGATFLQVQAGTGQGSTDLSTWSDSTGTAWARITNTGNIVSPSSQLNPGSATQPACDTTTRGMLWFIRSSSGINTSDHLKMCAKDADDNYQWLQVF